MSLLTFLSKLFICELIDCDIKPMLCGQQLKAERIRQGLAKVPVQLRGSTFAKMRRASDNRASYTKSIHAQCFDRRAGQTKQQSAALQIDTEGVNMAF